MLTQVTNDSKGYLHGYSQAEQQRLYDQAKFLSPYVYDQIDLDGVSNLLEVGCGVGAQTAILIERYPGLKITAVDYEPKQVYKANRFLESDIKVGRVRVELADATALPYPDRYFESAFLCWVLEHVQDPKLVMSEVARVLVPGGRVIMTEVLNTPLTLYPRNSAVENYWQLYNEQQHRLGGDPIVGAKLGNLSNAVGLEVVRTRLLKYFMDGTSSVEDRRSFYTYWENLFLSAAPQLIAAKNISARDVEAMVEGFKAMKENAESLFFLVAMQVTAQKKIL